MKNKRKTLDKDSHNLRLFLRESILTTNPLKIINFMIIIKRMMLMKNIKQIQINLNHHIKIVIRRNFSVFPW
jgi:hypothetical protein